MGEGGSCVGLRGARAALPEYLRVNMTKKNGSTNSLSSSPPVTGISRVTVGGFKSLAREQSIDIRPLTVLAGANSSGKSSIMQPLLLLQQTLEASYDPGALLLDGANLRFTSVDQ